MNQLKTVFKFEYNSYVKNKIFIIITVLLIALVVIAINIPNIMNVVDSIRGETEYGAEPEPGLGDWGQSDITGQAALIDPLGDYSDETLSWFFPHLEFVRHDSFDIDFFMGEIDGGVYEFALYVRDLEYQVVQPGGAGMFAFPLAGINSMVVFAYQEKMGVEFGLNSEQIERIQSAWAIGQYHFAGADLAQTFWIGYVMLMLLFLTIQFYGQMVMTSVITEKSSKAMELLITSVKPVQLMFGKVLGTGLAGLTQLGLFLASAFIMFRLTIAQWEDFAPAVANIMNMSLSFDIIVLAVVFFLLGFLMFSFLFAGFGSTVSRLEDANKVVMIPLMLFMASFFIAMFGGMTAPDSTFFTVASFVPFLSPLVMFMRVCLQIAPMYQVLIAIGINVVSVIAVGILCAKIYRAGVLMYGKPLSIVEIFKQLARA